MPKSVGVLERTFHLLCKQQWTEVIVEIDKLFMEEKLKSRLLRGAALAMKAEAVEKLGRIDMAAAILAEAVEVDIAASKQFAELVLRENIVDYYAKALKALDILLDNKGSDPLAEMFAQAMVPLQKELEQRLKIGKPENKPNSREN